MKNDATCPKGQPVTLIDRVGSMVTGNARTKAKFPGVVVRSRVPRSRTLKGNDAGRWAGWRRGSGGKIERKAW